MTNSTEATKTDSAKKSKAARPRGPLRTEAVVPTLIVLALIGAYFAFFFDNHLRRGIEWTATMIHGAEVNVGRIATSFLNASFEMNDLQVTDKNKPQRNIVQVGTMRFQLSWDALLRAKIVVDNASILDIQALTPRKAPGRLIPPPAAKDGGPGMMQKAQDAVLSQAKAQFNDNLLGDLANVLSGVDPKDQLKTIEGELKSALRLKELESELKAKEQAWKQRLKEMPKGKEVDELGKRLKALRFDAKNPIEFAKSVKDAEKILKEADQKIRTVKETGKSLNEDVNTYTRAFKELETMVQQDLKDLQARLKIPDVNGGDFSKNLFMGMFMQRLASVRKYADVAKQYMPPKRQPGAEPPEVVPRPRGAGKTYRFPITTGYPLFWLKHGAISSEVSSSAEYSGNIKGEIKDLTSDPQYLKRPAIITVKGDFPKQGISGVDLRLVLDHTTDQPKQDLSLKIASYPMGELKLVESKDVTFQLQKSTGGLDFNARLAGEQIDVNLTNAFTQVEYGINAKSALLKDVLTKVMADIPVIDIKARATGTWDKISFSVSSNLGDELSRGFKAQVQAKIDEAKAKLRALLDERIGTEQRKLTAKFDKIKADIGGEIGKNEAEIDQAKKTAQAEFEKQKNQGGTKKLEEEGKKLLKKLRLGG